MHVFHILIILLILNYSNNATELTQTTYTTPERPINVVVRKNRRDVVETQTQNEYCYQESVKLSCGKVKYYRVCKQVEVDPLKQIRRKLEPGENLIPSCILESSSSDVTTRYDCTSSALSFSSHNNFTGALVKANPFSGCIKLINRVNLNTESTYTVHYDKNDNSLGFRLSKKNQFDIIVSDLSVTAKRKGILSNDRLLKINSWCTKSHTFQEVAKKLKFADYPLTLTFESSDHHKNDHVDKFAVLMQRYVLLCCMLHNLSRTFSFHPLNQSINHSLTHTQRWM